MPRFLLNGTFALFLSFSSSGRREEWSGGGEWQGGGGERPAGLKGDAARERDVREPGGRRPGTRWGAPTDQDGKRPDRDAPERAGYDRFVNVTCTAWFTQDAQADFHANLCTDPLMLLASCVNTHLQQRLHYFVCCPL